MIANEAIDSRISEKRLGILCKLDIEKAYDHVNEEVVMQILRHMSFGEMWINWVNFCISPMKFSIPSMIRQMNSLSPFLFVLPMVGLNNMVKIAKANGWIQDFELARNNDSCLEITHFQYADDSLMFCDVEEEQLKYLRVTLVLFEGSSGLHTNRRKSHIYPYQLGA